jgi:hypothetical protein
MLYRLNPLKLIKKSNRSSVSSSSSNSYEQAIRREAKIGATLFGPIPDGVTREFFCLDAHTWIWHEEWLDANNRINHKTTRYDVRPDGIIKAQDGIGYVKVSKAEAANLLQAAKAYQVKTKELLYTN